MDIKERVRELAMKRGEFHDFEFDYHWNYYQNCKMSEPWLSGMMVMARLEHEAETQQ